MSLVKKLMEITEAGIIKNFYRKEKFEWDFEFYDDIPPEKALEKLDLYLYEKYGLKFDD